MGACRPPTHGSPCTCGGTRSTRGGPTTNSAGSSGRASSPGCGAAPTSTPSCPRIPPTGTACSCAQRSPVLRCHVARLRDDEIEEVDGLAVTSLARTALDLARSLPHEAAVVALDAALRRGRLSHDVLRARLFDLAGAPGSRAAARAVDFADGRSESVGESRSRVLLHRWGVGPSSLQFEVRGEGGLLVARTDFAWEEHGLVGEFDGRVKYGRLLRPGQDPGDAVFEEKRREDAVREEGLGMVRWVWADLSAGHRLAARVRRAQERTRR